MADSIVLQDLGIPALSLPDDGGAAIPDCWEKWGRIGRSTVLGEQWGYHFYTADLKFENCWRYPDRLVDSGVKNVIEPNYSTYKGQPKAVALFDIYRKRTLAAYWQTKGIRIWVDLNVEADVYKLNSVGVPKKYPYFATRYQRRLQDGSLQGLDGVKRDFEQARNLAGGTDIRFLVYGGAGRVKDFCLKHGFYWVPDSNNWRKGRGA